LPATAKLVGFLEDSDVVAGNIAGSSRCYATVIASREANAGQASAYEDMTMVGLPETNTTGGPPPIPPIVRPLKPTGLLKSLGPGLVTGAADDDPSGIATYSQVGAQFGYGLAWTMLFSFPLMAVIQAVSARIGCVTGYGIARNLRRHYSPWLLRAVVLLLLVANVINLGVDPAPWARRWGC
jgi:hypothetical protein